MVQEYVSDALVGEDKEYAEQLLSRKAPLFEWLKYYFHMLIHTQNGLYRLFKETIPLMPYKRANI